MKIISNNLSDKIHRIASDLVNGNLTDAKRMAKLVSGRVLLEGFESELGWTYEKAFSAAKYLKCPNQQTYQAYCDNPSTRTEVRSPTSTEVRSPTSTETSTEAFTEGNITVTGGAGAGSTRVSIYPSDRSHLKSFQSGKRKIMTNKRYSKNPSYHKEYKAGYQLGMSGEKLVNPFDGRNPRYAHFRVGYFDGANALHRKSEQWPEVQHPTKFGKRYTPNPTISDGGRELRALLSRNYEVNPNDARVGRYGQAQYEANEMKMLQHQLKLVENAPLADRKAGVQDLFNSLKEESEYVARNMGWMIHGEYGFGAKQKALQIIAATRSNREALLLQLYGALECQSPKAGTIEAWKKLSSAQKQRLARIIQQVIHDAKEKQIENLRHKEHLDYE